MTILNQFFTRTIPETRPDTVDPAVAEDVVTAYCYALEFFAPTPGCVADESELPFPKETIKQALRWRMQHTSDADFRDSLKVAYVALADWQQGVGPDHRGLAMLPGQDGLARTTEASWITERAVEGAQWTARSNAEAERLHRELMALGI